MSQTDRSWTSDESAEKNMLALAALERIHQLAKSSKWQRMLSRPARYLSGMLFREVIFPFRRKARSVKARLFWNETVNVYLPASMDIYLFGTKTHDSEIRLAKFILHHVRRGEQFLDVGAHIGYYSLLASYCTGSEGRIIAIEPARNAHVLLRENAGRHANIEVFNMALNDETGVVDITEFPSQYAEYSTVDPARFLTQGWYRNVKPSTYQVAARTGDQLLAETGLRPSMIKIDVEGWEYNVIRGLRGYLEANSPCILMEFLSDGRVNEAHQAADGELRSLGYAVFSILADGNLSRIAGATSDYVAASGLESDNIVYRKKSG